MAAGGSEIGDKPLRREVMGDFLVFFRDAHGKVVGARDACPHRGFPLSDGHLIGGQVQCRYHGIRFDGTGRCVGIPSNPRAAINEAMRLKVYPTVEKSVWIWVWMGDPALADPNLIPDFNCQASEGYEHHFLAPFGPHLGNAQLIRENLCDGTHVTYLHANLVDASDDATFLIPQKMK
ncbi:MAG TPA: Rieske 2Fe-2S domain-containing protein, partial [Steroidobacteraceae bacterium]